MDISILETGNKELAKELIKTTNRLVKDRQELLGLQRDHMAAKMELKRIDAVFLQEITSNPNFKNDRARDSKLMERQRSSEDYKKWMLARNQRWVDVQQQEIEIEKTDNEIKNLRVLLKMQVIQ
jgi:hypothetical protein